jgi:type II secretory ATPase GspE/PulE/Tfp pilus assembly ATPase PilB-like protein
VLAAVGSGRVGAMGKASPARLWHPVGREHHAGFGCSGHTAIFGIRRVGPNTADRIVDEQGEQKLQQSVLKPGHHLRLDGTLDKVARGIIDLRQVRAVKSSH